MIPVRVLVRNFLCYDEAEGGPIEFDFEGSPLWSISGDNGAGKSAIFDAITYALFGCHRGGQQQDARLIRRGANHCEAIFEFRQHGQLYRVRRTVGRPRKMGGPEPKTWQAAWFDEEVSDWRTVPGTEQKALLERWVDDTLGFGYDTFVASVLLLQGQSDHLITAKAKDRFDILSGILELDAYKKVAASASARATDARRTAELLEQQLAQLPVAAQEEIADARQKAEACDALLEKIRKTREEARLVQADAGRYQQLTTDLLTVQRECSEIDDLTKNADAIREEHEEWSRLSDAVPRCQTALDELTQAEKAAVEVRAALSAVKKLGAKTLQAEVEACEQTIEVARQNEREIRDRQEKVANDLPKVRELLRCRRAVDERLALVKKFGGPKECAARRTEAETALKMQQELAEKAEAARTSSQAEFAQAAASLQTAEAALQGRIAAKDEAVCSRCGQRVTAEHTRREVEDAERTAAKKRADRNEKKAALEQAQAEVTQASKPLQQLTEAVSNAHVTSERATEAANGLEEAQREMQAALSLSQSGEPELLAVIAEGALAAAASKISATEKVEGELKKLRTEAAKGIAEAESALIEAREKRAGAVKQSEELKTAATTWQAESERLRGQAKVRVAQVEPDWQRRTLEGDGAFVSRLEERLLSLAGADERFKHLLAAETERTKLEVRLQTTKSEIAKIPEHHRLAGDAANSAYAKTKRKFESARTERDEARSTVQRLEQDRAQRTAVEENARRARRRRALYGRLADLLGRGGLQAYLMDAALDGIDRLANETLARISGGQLQVHLARETTRQVDEEIVIRATDLASSDESLDIPFISGGQKFRSSVALAAGIGQYASGSKESVQSLIIDEGFGSLDSQGRQEMIEELQNLSQLMDRIIVVSHQEDFQDRTLFPTGYVLRKAGQRTIVEKFV